MYFQQICSYTKDACNIVGKFIKEEQPKILEHDIEIKGQNDFVSYVDKKAEFMLIEQLDKLIFDAGYIVEEGSREQQNKEFTWIIDPLDGTTNYLHGLSPHAISIALMNENELVMGVVHDITTGEQFYAWKNGGSWLDGTQIQVSNKQDIKSSLIATGFPYQDFSKTKEYLIALEYLMKNSHGIRRLGSAAMDLAYVACGRMDAFYEYGLKPWDIAAGAFIVMEAGGIVTDFSGNDNWLFGKELVCGNPHVGDELSKLIQSIF